MFKLRHQDFSSVNTQSEFAPMESVSVDENSGFINITKEITNEKAHAHEDFWIADSPDAIGPIKKIRQRKLRQPDVRDNIKETSPMAHTPT